MNKTLKTYLFKLFVKTPFFNQKAAYWYSKLGVQGNNFKISSKVDFVGDYTNLYLGNQAEINHGCFLLLKDKLTVGNNTTLAYQVTVLTSANPNEPHNSLSKIYPKTTKPIKIGHNTWVGARATILPGVKIGNYCVIAAGALVNKDIPDFTVVAGVPAKPIETLTPDLVV